MFKSLDKHTAFFALSLLIGLGLWFGPRPEGVAPQAWHLFAIFVAAMVGIILKPLPMGAVSLFALTVAVSTQTLTLSDAFSGFANEVVWLVVFAFFVARGFIATGLGTRIAYRVMSWLGKSSLGLGYGLVATDLLLAPTIPSVTARVGGIVYPIVKALAEIFTGKAHDPKMGAFLTLASFQGSAITSAMFLTSMAGNPLILELSRSHGIELTWANWALAALVPGILSLIIVPYAIFRWVSPVIRQTPDAKEMAAEKLRKMGPMKVQEWIMLGIFVLLITLWILGPKIQMKATVAAMIGLAVLLLSGILRWKDILDEQSAWDTFIWFATLVTLATYLNKFGLMSWFSEAVVGQVQGMSWLVGFPFVALIYFYTHYFFASNIAHISAMYAPLLIVSIALGTPPLLAALALAFFSSLYGGLTHYGSGPAPILYGTGYVAVGQWWKVGAAASLLNIAIWGVLGGLWWKVLGLW